MGVIPLINGLSMAYKWGDYYLLTKWYDPPSRIHPPQFEWFLDANFEPRIHWEPCLPLFLCVQMVGPPQQTAGVRDGVFLFFLFFWFCMVGTFEVGPFFATTMANNKQKGIFAISKFPLNQTILATKNLMTIFSGNCSKSDFPAIICNTFLVVVFYRPLLGNHIFRCFFLVLFQWYKNFWCKETPEVTEKNHNNFTLGGSQRIF